MGHEARRAARIRPSGPRAGNKDASLRRETGRPHGGCKPRWAREAMVSQQSSAALASRFSCLRGRDVSRRTTDSCAIFLGMAISLFGRWSLSSPMLIGMVERKVGWVIVGVLRAYLQWALKTSSSVRTSQMFGSIEGLRRTGSRAVWLPRTDLQSGLQCCSGSVI